MNTVVFDLGNVLVDYNGGVCVDMLGYTGEVKKELILSLIHIFGDENKRHSDSLCDVFSRCNGNRNVSSWYTDFI